MSKAASLKSGMCGLTDGSKVYQWRLPTRDELINRQKNQVGFSNVKSSWYWSSSTHAKFPNDAWYVNMSDGHVDIEFKASFIYVWPVRAGQ